MSTATNCKHDKWQSVSQIRRELSANGKTEELCAAFALSRFAESARLPEKYSAASDWERLVVLSEAGERFVDLIPDVRRSYPLADVKMAAFSRFYHHDLLLDIDRTDTAGILNLLNSELLTYHVRWPFIQGRILYDKFNDTIANDRIDHLAPPEVFPFLDGTPQGIFHVGQIVSGPLGFLPTRQKRFHRARAGAELWHCSDPGCRTAHFVKLLQPDVTVVQIRRDLGERAQSALGPPSEWNKVLGDIAAGPAGNRLRLYYDITAIVAECVLAEDRTTLVERALRSDSAPFVRDVIAKARGAEAIAGAPRTIAERLSTFEQLQVLFTLSDEELVALVDQAVLQQAISIPANEEREPNLRPPRRYFTEIPSTLSSLGVRELIKEPIASLCAMLCVAYTKTANTAELDWRIRNMGGAPTEEALLRYLRTTPPSTAIRELVLASEPITTFIIDQLQYTGSLQSGDLVSQILWKVGFEVPRFTDTYRRLRKRLQVFRDTILQISAIRSEDDREKIRSAGVNLFVSIEQVLEELIAYSVWLLHSDHFLGTRFTFDLHEAKAQVASVLGPKLDEFAWKIEAENTLGTLYRYLQEASDWMKGLLSRDRETVIRPKGDLPHYVDTHEKKFPFYHLELWADVHPSALGAFVDDFQKLARKFFQSEASNIRNGLDHQRPQEEFPSIDAMLGFTAKFTEALDHADVNRYVPKEFWGDSLVQDQFDRIEYRLRDYDGRTVAIYEPSFAVGARDLELRRPMLVAPGNLMAHVGLTLTFSIREKTNYSDHWKGYPRRRQIPEGPVPVVAPSNETKRLSNKIPDQR